MDIQKDLQDIGLQEKEAKVYVATLELGKGTAQEISKKAEVNRATTYFVLENLMKKGLVSASNEEKKQMFTPEDPSQLANLIEQQKAELEAKKGKIPNLVKNLESINASNVKKPIVKYYIGKEGIMRMAKSSFEFAEGETMWVAFSKDMLKDFLSDEENSELIKLRTSNEVASNVLYNSSEGKLESDAKNERIYISNDYPFPGDVAVYKDKVRLTSYSDQIGIIIENKNIATTITSLMQLAMDKKAK